MTTELVINALKHAFTDGRQGEVVVAYQTKNGSGWELSVSDNGVGHSKKSKLDQPGLGTGIISALAEKLEAKVRTKSSELGTMVSINYTGAKLKPI